jgi:uncharacterized repeat protein (TIGR03803 family)
MQTSETRLRAVSVALGLAIVLVAAVMATPSAQASHFTVLYNFTGGADGAYPMYGSLVLDKAGNLYGTDSGGASGYGVVFKLDAKNGKLTVLYSFTGGEDGATPYAGLVRDAAGNLYGTTTSGGASGYGVVFKLEKTGKESVLYSFTGGNDGGKPIGGLVRDSAGNLYGTTNLGGALGCGVVFRLDKTGKETVLHNFSGWPTDGCSPVSSLVLNKAGNLLFGATNSGGAWDVGVVFKMGAKTGEETVLHSFNYSTGDDGAGPWGALLVGPGGDLYGTTSWGGNGGSDGDYDVGTVFKVDPETGKEAVLWDFDGIGEDEGGPYGGVIQNKAGKLYGTSTEDITGDSPGAVWELDPKTGNLSVLYNFSGPPDGAYPLASLVMDPKGALYGTTEYGGSGSCSIYWGGCGVVFKLVP